MTYKEKQEFLSEVIRRASFSNVDSEADLYISHMKEIKEDLYRLEKLEK